jgi:hypothetical protein
MKAVAQSDNDKAKSVRHAQECRAEQGLLMMAFPMNQDAG